MKFLAALTFTVACLVIPVRCSFAAFQSQPAVWKPVVIGGGGFVSGIVASPVQPGLIYARCDIGGAYRWDNLNSVWVPITDWVGRDNYTYMGIESIAPDPVNPNVVYLAAGMYVGAWFPYNGAILRSADQGSTWTITNMPFKMGGNEDGRGNGERLAVDPNSNNILFFGSRANGLWKSTDSAATWTQVTSFPVMSTSNGAGIVFVQFVKSSGTSGNPTPVIYAGVSDPTISLYQSVDEGSTWTPVAGAPTGLVPHRMAQAGDGSIYISYSNVCGPNGASSGAVWKYIPSTATWTNVSPPSGGGGFGGIAVDANNPQTVMAATLDHWSPHDLIYRSTDGGATWVNALDGAVRSDGGFPWSAQVTPHWMESVMIDPFNSAHVLFGTGMGVFGTNNITSLDSGGEPTWTFTDAGIEETYQFTAACPPSGPALYSTMGDIEAFVNPTLDQSPPVGDHLMPWGNAYSVDFAGTNPAVVARNFNNSPFGAYSLNSGSTWTNFAAYPPAVSGYDRGSIAVSADGSTFVWSPNNSVSYYSKNNGASWTECSGPSSSSATYNAVADKTNPSKFYIYAPDTGSFYLSVDGGVTFASTGATLATGGVPPVSTPGFDGDVWLALTAGLFHSTNSGASFSQIPGVQSAYLVAVGAAASGRTYPSVYINGVIDGVTGFFRSDDAGATWARINDDHHQFGNISSITADPNVWGRMYLCTQGRGLIYSTATSPSTPAGLTAMAGNGQVELSWSPANGATTYNVYRGVTSGGEAATPIATSISGTGYVDRGLTNGTTYYYTIAAVNSYGASGSSNEESATPAAPAPYGGTPAAVPGTLQAENYDTGGQGVAYNVTSHNGTANSYRADGVDLETTTDAGGGYDLGWTGGGQWFDYTVNVATAGTYSVAVRVAAWTAVGAAAGSFHIQDASGANLSGSISVPGTGGWQTWTTVYATVSLPAGTQTLTVAQETGGYNFNYFTFTLQAPPAAPTGLTATAGNAQVALSWSPSGAATSYNVYRGTSAGAEAATPIATAVGSTSYTDKGLTNLTAYYYKIAAVNNVGASSLSNEAGALPTSYSSAIANGNHTLTPQNATGSRLDANAWGTTNGTKVQIWQSNGGYNQSWSLTNLGGGVYKIQPSYATSLCLDVNSGSTVNGTLVDLWACGGGTSQQWGATSVGGNVYTFAPRNATGERLDVTGVKTANGTQVEIWQANGGSNQSWAVN